MRNRLPNIVIKHLLKFELFLLFLLLLIFSSYNFLKSCQFFQDLSFDNQIFIAWQHSSLVGLLPYKNIYYPYGIMTYFKNTVPLFSLLNIVFTPILFSIVFIAIRNIWKNRIICYLLFTSFFIFIVFYTNLNVFNRYGIMVCMGLLFAFLFSRRIYISVFQAFAIGITTGVIFSLINDQGIYSFFLFVLLQVLNPIIRNGLIELKKRKYYLQILKIFFSYTLGFFVGFMPFFIFLIKNDMLSQFTSYTSQISDFAIYGKTPFIPYSMTIDNIFIYITLFTTVFLLTYRLSLAKRIFNLSLYMKIVLLVLLVFLEQKSIVRSISTQITFVSYLLLIFLLYELNAFLTKKNISTSKRVLTCGSIVILIFCIGLNSNNSFQFRVPVNNVSSLNEVFHQVNRQCLEKNLFSARTIYPSYKYIESKIKRDSEKPVIFDYLSDPVFYALFNQKPPYYFTIFESTPLYAQEENIKYIKKHNVEYIIYNINMSSIADGVPEYIRGNLLFKYLVNNFEPYDKKDSFIIFKKKNNTDFFKQESSRNITEFRKYLLNINLGAIPRSEGRYKFNFLTKNANKIKSGDSEKINLLLKSNVINSSNKFLVLTPELYTNHEKQMKIVLGSQHDLYTIVTFYRCGVGESCIINISNLPLFYKERVLTKIIVDKSFKGRIQLIENQTNKELW